MNEVRYNATLGKFQYNDGTPANGDVLVAIDTDGNAEWSALSALGLWFKTIVTPNGTNPVATVVDDTLTFAEGGIATVTGDSGTNTITISATEIQELFKTISVSGQDNVVADGVTDTLTFVAGTGVTITTSAAGDSITIAATSGASELDDLSDVTITGPLAARDALVYNSGTGVFEDRPLVEADISDLAHTVDTTLPQADYLVGTANGGLSAEIVVGTSPGGELGNTWASPTVDATHSGSAHHDAVTLAGTPDYVTLSGQVITRGTVDIGDDTNLAVTAPVIKTGDTISLAGLSAVGASGTGPVSNGTTWAMTDIATQAELNASTGIWENYTGTHIRPTDVDAEVNIGGRNTGAITAQLLVDKAWTDTTNAMVQFDGIDNESAAVAFAVIDENDNSWLSLKSQSSSRTDALLALLGRATVTRSEDQAAYLLSASSSAASGSRQHDGILVSAFRSFIGWEDISTGADDARLNLDGDTLTLSWDTDDDDTFDGTTPNYDDVPAAAVFTSAGAFTAVGTVTGADVTATDDLSAGDDVLLSDGAVVGITGAERIIFDGTGDDISVMGADFGIGTDDPQENLHIAEDGQAGIRVVRADDTNSGSVIDQYKARGSVASPTALSSTERMFLNRAYGYANGDYQLAGYLSMQKDGTVSGSNVPTQFHIATNNGSATAQRFTIKPDGSVGINDSAPSASLDVHGNIMGNAGSGTEEYGVGGTIYSNSSAVSGGDGGEEDLMSFTLPANTLTTNGDSLEVTIFGTVTGSDTQQIDIEIGGTAVIERGINSTQDWVGTFGLMRSSDTNLKWFMDNPALTAFLSADFQNITVSDLDENTLVIKCTAENVSGSGDDITQEGMIVKYFPAAP